MATLTRDGALIPKLPGILYVTAVNEAATAVVGVNTTAGSLFGTITGVVVDTNGVPAGGVQMSLDGVLVPPVMTVADGRFTITGEIPIRLSPTLGYFTGFRRVAVPMKAHTRRYCATYIRILTRMSHPLFPFPFASFDPGRAQALRCEMDSAEDRFVRRRENTGFSDGEVPHAGGAKAKMRLCPRLRQGSWQSRRVVLPSDELRLLCEGVDGR